MFYTYLECVMFMRKDITDLNPNENLHQMASELINYAPNDLTEDNLHIIDDSILYMVNDLIFTSAGVMLKDPEIGVNKSGGRTWEQWDIDPFDPVPYVDDEHVKKKCENGCGCNGCDDEHGDNVAW